MQNIIKRIDSRGRIHIPQNFRDVLHLKIGDEVNIKVYDKTLLIRPEDKRCIFCEKKTKELFNNKFICPECVAKIKKL